MRALRSIPLVSAVMALSACFVSETPLMPEGEGLQLAYGPVTLCDGLDSCVPAELSGDGYLIEPEQEGDKPGFIRFGHLTGYGVDTVYLAEALVDDDEDGVAWFYFVAHEMPPAEDGTRKFMIVQPDCMEATDEQVEAFGITEMDSYTCTVDTWEDLAGYLIEAYADAFDDQDWWLDN